MRRLLPVVAILVRRLRASKGRLEVTVSFPGNGVLTSRRAKARVVRFG